LDFGQLTLIALFPVAQAMKYRIEEFCWVSARKLKLMRPMGRRSVGSIAA
jgi:hypothetical protein